MMGLSRLSQFNTHAAVTLAAIKSAAVISAAARKATVKKIITVAACSLLWACGDGAGDDAGAGDGAGDVDGGPQQQTIAGEAALAISPAVGVWQLPQDWNGGENPNAYLLIAQADSNGEARAVIFAEDNSTPGAERNCFTIDGFAGQVTHSFTDMLFLDITAFPTAIISLRPNGDLQIQEVLANNSADERTLTASRLNITENEIPLCE